MAPQRNKGLSADYEFPAMSAAGVDKKQSKQHVPEGVLIDLGDDVPPLPSKRHSVGSVTKDGVGSRYENVEVKPSGFSSHRSASSPNVLDDSWLFNSSCLHPTVDNLPQGVPPGNVKEHAESRGFHTLPNRMHPDSGPKRCPLTAEAFQEPGASGGGGGGGGLGVMHSTPGQYYLVGAVNPPSQSPPKTMVNPQVVPQPNQGSQLQKQRPAAPQPKRQGDQPKPRTPVGAYSLVGIPEAGGPILHAPSPVSTPATVKSENSKESTGVPVEVKVMSITGLPAESKGKPTTGGPVEVKGKLNASVPVEVKGKPNAGVPVEVKGKSTTGIPVEVKGKPNAGVPVEIKGKPNTGVPVEVKGKPIAEPSYELVGQWQQAGKKVSPPSVQPYKPRNVGSPDGTTGANREPHSSQLLLHNVDKQNAVAKSKSTPDISLRSQGDGEPQTVNDVTVAPDVYATVAQRTRDKTESQDRNSSNLSTGSPNLRTQSSSGSLRSFTSTSSDEGDSPPAVPQKTNEAFLVPGEEPYEAVQQTNKGTLDRFKKMMKSGSKGSLPKRLSDVTLPLGLPRTNSSGTATVRWEEKGYKKRFPKPAGPRPCPANWPSCVHLGL
ncbi:hypothetical protein OS493_019096 [Desmophyllum pertusum]|uniref:Uncharacterized protein n=1 Tax=Desmophyllum pertusum TaxID=174260 RepID=A0A9X0CLM4_9CNID|nr:hypothetical protein OS493_019096 [Desmophyllum pertusum]